jgi:tetratricopeptide (TPR) repeat protein
MPVTTYAKFIAAILLFAAPCAPLVAQGATAAIADGDVAHARYDSRGALDAYTLALESDSTSYEALWKASRDAADLGQATPDDDVREALYQQATDFARRAVAIREDDAEGHFALARALGLRALSVGPRARVKYATEVRAEALRALAIDSLHPGALHVMGVWNAEVMRLNGFTRFFAKNVLGGKVFDEASWENAVRYMERAVAVDPQRLTHRLDLGMIYLDTDQKAKAREMFESVVSGARSDVNDPAYKRDAERELRELGR